MQKFVFLLCCMDASHALNTSPTSIMFYQCFLPTGGLLIHLPFSIFWWAPISHFDEVYPISVFFHHYCFLCPVLETFAYAHIPDFLHMSGFNWFAPLSSARATFLSSTHLGSPPQYQALVPTPARQHQHKSGLWPLRLSLATQVISGSVPEQKFWNDKTKETFSQDPGLPRFSLKSGEKLREWQSQPPACWFPWMILFFPLNCIHRSLSQCLRWIFHF